MRSRLIPALGLALRLLAGGQDRPPDEYQVKAAFLLNFAKFVEWPAGAFADPHEPLVLCVLGEDPFGRALDDAVSGKRIEGRAIVIRRISDARRVKECRMLFVSSSERRHVLSVIASSCEPGLLTIGESDSATAQGLIINFILEGGKVRFAIDAAAAEREKLRFSSRLLSLALTVKR